MKKNKIKKSAQFKAWYYKPENRLNNGVRGKRWRAANPEKVTKVALAYANSEWGYLMGLWNGIKKHHTNLTKEQFFKLAYAHKEKMGGWRSGYNGEQMTMQRLGSLNGKKQQKPCPMNVSVDRLDNSRIYSYDNIIFCTWKENNHKGAMSIKLMRQVLNIIEERKNET